MLDASCYGGAIDDGHGGIDAAGFEGEFIDILAGVAKGAGEFVATLVAVKVAYMTGQTDNIGIFRDELVKIVVGIWAGRAEFTGEKLYNNWRCLYVFRLLSLGLNLGLSLGVEKGDVQSAEQED